MSARVLYLELAASEAGVCLKTGRVPASMPESAARSLWGRMTASRNGLREILAATAKDGDIEAIRSEGRSA